MNIEFSTLIITFINCFIILALLSLLIFAIFKIVKNLCNARNTNALILKELKDISSKIDKKD